VWVALQLSAHPIVIARMLVNLGLDALLGAIPLLGPIADFFYRANLKNVALLEARRDPRVTGADYAIVVAAGVAFLIALLIPILIVAWLAYWLWLWLGAAWSP
ncbi:MAG TPA: DUF4112 domain-containing protein, partial [Polyangiaceae bacterium]|nr:DUF4112 domain-containing protein [Polyangiaceae bacterium]